MKINTTFVSNFISKSPHMLKMNSGPSSSCSELEAAQAAAERPVPLDTRHKDKR